PMLHLASFVAGSDNYMSVERLLKSILLFHRGPIHYHFIANTISREVLSALLQTWQIENCERITVRWSIYESEDDRDRLGWIRSSRDGAFSPMKLVLDEILPLYVDKVCLIDFSL
ncbi:hypothetical protein PFISCL1PPCAC_13170, partial [Pristionchus fissidentatus]